MSVEKPGRWTAKKKREFVLMILKKEVTIPEICKENDLKQSEVQGWIYDFINAGANGLKSTAKLEKSQRDKEVKEMKAKIGELVLENDVLKKAKALMEDQEEINY